MKKIRVGIAGGAGYTGGELLRLLVHHPHADVAGVQSRSAAGKYVYEVHRDLLGDTDLKFGPSAADNIDVLFLCLGHGQSKKFLEENRPAPATRVIDLSQDFRLNAAGFVYGLPEWNKQEISAASNIANPGCFATAIQLALLPLVKGDPGHGDVHIQATTGSTGAGQSLVETSHYSWRNNNFSSYKPFGHQHLDEIRQSVRKLNPAFNSDINFIPHRGSFARGIHVSMYTTTTLSSSGCSELFNNAYASSPFVFVSDSPVDMKQVVNTNKCFIHLEKHGDKLLVTSVLDNLLKGAAGQAVQNMNLMFGLEETSGLKLKSIAF